MLAVLPAHRATGASDLMIDALLLSRHSSCRHYKYLKSSDVLSPVRISWVLAQPAAIKPVSLKSVFSIAPFKPQRP